MYISPPPPFPVTVRAAPCGDGKTTLAPPGGCGRGGGGGCRRPAVKDRNPEERARTLFRLQQAVASLSFSGARRSVSPLTSSSSRTAAAAPSPFPLPLFLFRRGGPGAPRPRQPRSSARRWTEGEGSGGKPRGHKLGTERAGRQGRKVARSHGGKVPGGGVFRAGPDVGLRRGLPSPSPGLGRGPRAGDGPGRGRGPPPPRRETSHICG